MFGNYQQYQRGEINAFGPQTPAQKVLEGFNTLGIPPEADTELRGSLVKDEIKPAKSSIMSWLEKVPEFKPWPQQLLEHVATSVWDGVKFSGQVLEGKADPRDPANFHQVMNMAVMAIGMGWGPVKAAYPGIGNEEIKALDAYTGSAYATLNRYLENRLAFSINPSTAKELDLFAQRLDRIIAEGGSAASTKDLTVFRGVPGRSFVARYPELAPGDVIRFDAFTSTSKRFNTAKGFAGDVAGIVFEIKVPKGAPALDVEPTLARYGSSTINEKEVLIPRKTEFKIVNLDRDNRVIQLEMVPPGTKVPGERIEARPPGSTSTYSQDVDQLLKDLKKSPSYIDETPEAIKKLIPNPVVQDYLKAVNRDGYTGTLDEWLSFTGNQQYVNKPLITSAAETMVPHADAIKMLEKHKTNLYAKANKLEANSDKWWNIMDNITDISTHIQSLAGPITQKQLNDIIFAKYSSSPVK